MSYICENSWNLTSCSKDLVFPHPFPTTCPELFSSFFFLMHSQLHHDSYSGSSKANASFTGECEKTLRNIQYVNSTNLTFFIFTTFYLAKRFLRLTLSSMDNIDKIFFIFIRLNNFYIFMWRLSNSLFEKFQSSFEEE